MAMDVQKGKPDLTDFTRHGGRLDEARRLFPDVPLPWLDLSTGINPEPWQPQAPLSIETGSLPEVSALRDLEAAAARHFGVSPERVAAVPGSEIALRLLRSLGVPAPIACLQPSYATHGSIAQARIEAAQIGDGQGFAGTILLANPNNPDGRLFTPERLMALARRQMSLGGWLAIDEAFVDASPEASLVPHLTSEENVIVFRSFGKFFGHAGLRLGFVVAQPAVIARLRNLFGDWPVSAHAIAYGRPAYRDEAWIAATCLRLAEQATSLDRLLARHGMTGTGACPLFRLVEHPQAGVIFERLAGSGILVRPFADHPHWLRFGVPAREKQRERLDRALAGG